VIQSFLKFDHIPIDVNESQIKKSFQKNSFSKKQLMKNLYEKGNFGIIINF